MGNSGLSWTVSRSAARRSSAEVFTQDAEAGAEGGARLLVGGIAPEECGELLARVWLRMEGEVGEERFDLAARQMDWLAIALQAKRAEQVKVEGRRVASGAGALEGKAAAGITLDYPEPDAASRAPIS